MTRQPENLPHAVTDSNCKHEFVHYWMIGAPPDYGMVCKHCMKPATNREVIQQAVDDFQYILNNIDDMLPPLEIPPRQNTD